MSILWQMKLTLLNESSLIKVKIRHNRPIADADVILIYDRRQHYTTVGK